MDSQVKMDLLQIASMCLSQGCCFICSKICIKQNNLKLTSFKMLLRYLDIDIDKYSRTFDSGGNVDLCDGCLCKINGFWNLYQDFEMLRLYLNDFVECIYNLMKEGGSSSAQRLNQNMADHCSKFTMLLREVTIQKCALKVQSSPRVSLGRNNYPVPAKHQMSSDNQNYFDFEDCDLHLPSNCSDLDTNEDIDVKLLLPTCHIKVEPEEATSTSRIQEELITKTTSGSTPPSPPLKIKNMTSPPLANLCMPVEAVDPKNVKVEVEGDTEIDYQESNPIFKNIISPLPSGPDPSPHQEEPVKQRVQPKQVPSTIIPPASISAWSRSLPVEKPNTSKISENFLNAFRLTLETGLKPQQQHEMPKCKFCPKTFSNGVTRWSHIVEFHVMELYSSKIPCGTTKEQIDAATGALLQMHTTRTYASGRIVCIFCKKILSKTNFKRHLQDKHFDRILVRLRNKNRNDRSLEPVKIRKKYVSLKQPKKKEEDPKVKLKVKAPLENIKLINDSSQWSCKYCLEHFEMKYTLTVHSMMAHSYEYFKPKLTPGTTKTELEQAIEAVLSKTRITKDNMNRTRFECHSCSKVIPMRIGMKRHVLSAHFNEVIQELKQSMK